MSSHPSEIQVPNDGDSVRLNCSARGLPLPKVKWFKDGRYVSSVEVQDGKDLLKSECVIHRFEPNDTGTYTCLFYNDKNATAEANTSLSMWIICFVFIIISIKDRVPQTVWNWIIIVRMSQ